MRRFFFWSSGLLLVLVAAAIGALFLVDLSRYRAVLETQASAALGRAVVIEGALDIGASLTPTIAATQVTIANLPGGSREHMARIGRLEIGLELLPLLGGAVRITHVAMVDSDIALEIGVDGRGNWLFGDGDIDAEPPEVPSADQDGGTQTPFIGLLELRNTVVSHTGASGRTRRLDIAQARLAAASEDDDVRIEIECVIDGLAIEASATTGSLAAMSAAEEDWPVDLTLALGQSRISVTGTIADPTTFGRYVMAFDAEMASAEPVAILLHQPLPHLPPFSIAGSVSGDGDDVRLSQLSLVLGGSDVGGDLVLALAGERPAVTGDLIARRIELAEFSTGPQNPAADPAADPAPDPAADPAHDPAIPVAALGAADIDIRLRVDELVLPDLIVSGIRGGVRVSDRRLEIEIVEAGLYDGSLAADLSLDGRAQPVTAMVDMRVSQVNFGDLLSELRITDAVSGHADAAVTLAAMGETRQAMIASATGRATMNVGPGQISSTLASLVGRSVVTALLPIGDAETVQLNCAVGNFNVTDGVATSTALLVDTRRATIAGEGAIDIAGKRLDLVFNPRSKDPNLLALVAPVRVHGPLDQPEVSVLTGDLVADTAAGLLLGAINPIAIIIPFVTAGTGDENSCLAALNDELEVDSGSGPGRRLVGGAVDAVGGVAEGAAGVVGGVAGGVADGVGDAAAGVGGALGDVGRGIGNALGGLFGGGDDQAPPADDQ